jgi:antitoxin component YwqK of YwqJK toxin-antitoxin module
MKKVLTVLTVCLVFTSCSQDRVLKEELINKGTQESPLFYYNGELFTGVEFDVYTNGQLKYEYTIKDGIYSGLVQNWYENGQLLSEGKAKNNIYDGLIKEWYENGQLRSEMFYSNGLKQKEKLWGKNGELRQEIDYEKEREMYELGLFPQEDVILDAIELPSVEESLPESVEESLPKW